MGFAAAAKNNGIGQTPALPLGKGKGLSGSTEKHPKLRMTKSEHCPAQKVPALKGSLCEYILQQSWGSAKARKERNASCMYRERALFDGHLFNFSKEPTLIRNGYPDILINQQRQCRGGKKKRRYFLRQNPSCWQILCTVINQPVPQRSSTPNKNACANQLGSCLFLLHPPGKKKKPKEKYAYLFTPLCENHTVVYFFWLCIFGSHAGFQISIIVAK